MGPGHFMGNGFWIFPIVMMILCFLFFRSGIMKRGGLLFGDNNQTNGSNGSQSPLEILKTRYAKGEITKEEFEEMKSAL